MQYFFSFRLVLLIGLWICCAGDACAQFENEPASVAVDNTEHQFFGSNWRPSSEQATVGSTSMKTAFTPNNGNTTGAFLSFTDVTVTYDYLILPGTETSEFNLVGFDDFGELVRRELPTSPTGGWRTDQFYLPPAVTLFQWFAFVTSSQGGVFIDNVRITRGRPTPPPSPPSSRKECNSDNPFFGAPLSDALDNTFFQFDTGDSPWIRQTEISRFGGDAAQSGPISNGGISFMLTGIVSGAPYDLTWQWKVSSNPSNAELQFFLLDENFNLASQVQRLSGEQDWREGSVRVSPGLFFPVWAYVKANSGFAGGRDRGWVDKVNIGGSLDRPCINLAPIYDLIMGDNVDPPR